MDACSGLTKGSVHGLYVGPDRHVGLILRDLRVGMDSDLSLLYLV